MVLNFTHIMEALRIIFFIMVHTVSLLYNYSYVQWLLWACPLEGKATTVWSFLLICWPENVCVELCFHSHTCFHAMVFRQWDKFTVVLLCWNECFYLKKKNILTILLTEYPIFTIIIFPNNYCSWKKKTANKCSIFWMSWIVFLIKQRIT
jgi:hypothetical protein